MTLSLPPNATPAREQAILDYVQQGNCEFSWATVTSNYNGHTAEFQVFADALKIEGVRVNVCAKTEQLIADVLDCMLLTPKLADLAWLQRAVTIKPHTRAFSETTADMIAHSAQIDADLQALGSPSGLVCTVGKHWVLDNAIAGKIYAGVPVAMNYGWHFDGPTFQGQSWEQCASIASRLIQGRGTRHDMHHVDYSQICVLVSNHCTVDGTDMALTDVLTSPDLAPLASHQGVLNVLRQPGV